MLQELQNRLEQLSDKAYESAEKTDGRQLRAFAIGEANAYGVAALIVEDLINSAK